MKTLLLLGVLLLALLAGAAGQVGPFQCCFILTPSGIPIIRCE